MGPKIFLLKQINSRIVKDIYSSMGIFLEYVLKQFILQIKNKLGLIKLVNFYILKNKCNSYKTHSI